MAILLSAFTFIAWWILIGISVNDNRIFYWLGGNAVLLVLLQPWLMRMSRVVYIYIFISYDKNYETSPTKELHINEE